MQLHVGTSGYSYKEWKGTFYPEDLAAARMLPFYAGHFDTVEINNTFYRMPEEKTVAKWAAEVPDHFAFALKAPQRITHQKKLAGASGDVRYFFDAAAALGAKLGPVLVQLPPYFRKDVDRLRDFLADLPPDREIAFEFRHDSWRDPEVESLLAGHGAAWVASDTDEVTDVESLVVHGASWGYLRLRRTEYDEDALGAWRRRIARQPWETAWVFFKHEDEGKGPAFAKQFLALSGE